MAQNISEKTQAFWDLRKHFEICAAIEASSKMNPTQKLQENVKDKTTHRCLKMLHQK